jgi:uncharacterized membrane protein YkoI
MRRYLIGLAIAAVAAMTLAVPLAARADDDDDDHDHDHDRARELLEHGEIAALYDILRQVRAQASGEVVAVELIRRDNKWFYRFQVVAPDGRRSTVDVDASAEVKHSDKEEDD